jgi:hypothetical protein
MALRMSISIIRAPALCILMLGALLMPSCGTPARAEQSRLALDDLMQLLAQRQHRHATYIERQYLAILERPLESSGELFYDSPLRLEKRTLKPKTESLLLDNGVITVRRGVRRYELPLRDYPQLAALTESVLATLAGDRAALERAYSVSFEAQDNGWVIGLVPRESAVSAVVQRVRISGSADMVREVEVQRADGDRSVMTISELPSSDARSVR